MKLSAEQLQENWNIFLTYINKYISSPRKEKLLEFYEMYSERIVLLPASHKSEYHNAFPGGYIEHVNRVVNCAIEQHNLWDKMGADTSTYTMEELIFSALNHDLGKIGDEHNESYIPQTDQWRREKLGENYMFNTKLPFASVPDRGLYLLQSHGIQYTFNEMLAIQTHDGLWDEANKKYLNTFLPEQKPRTCLPYIIHQADLMAARIEFEREWLPKLKNSESDLPNSKKDFILNKKEDNIVTSKKNTIRSQALGSIKSEGLKNLLDNI
jgi:hypothetical protein